jgi:hypothetical protein
MFAASKPTVIVVNDNNFVELTGTLGIVIQNLEYSNNGTRVIPVEVGLTGNSLSAIISTVTDAMCPEFRVNGRFVSSREFGG